uniref:hypothetical protein n=1 Tax=Bifidobacterium adolescentis TaxID=1680 RepID=UPI0040268560
MDDPNADGEETTTPPPTEEARHTETVNDEIKPSEPEPEPKQEPDVSARLDALEKELAALKAMMDTLGYDEPATIDNDGIGSSDDPIEDLFD